MRFAKTGAVLYILWGLVHIKAGLDGFALGASLENSLVQGKINQGAWDVLIFALAAESYDWVMLITYRGFDEASGEYLFRRVVRAVLVSVD